MVEREKSRSAARVVLRRANRPLSLQREERVAKRGSGVRGSAKWREKTQAIYGKEAVTASCLPDVESVHLCATNKQHN
jgi:hypothetical protein